MKTTPLVSVLMPVYNGERYLREAIDSVLAQTYTHFELIICNDGSTDGSEEIILSYDDERIRYVKNEKNLGIVETRNRLFDLALGEYYAIMDSDDIAHKNKLAKQVDFLSNNPSVGVCGTWAYGINATNSICAYMQPPVSNAYIKINLLFQSSFIQSTVLIRKSILNDIRYDSNFPVTEDYDLWVRLNGLTCFHNIPMYLLHYRMHESNSTHQRNELMQERANSLIKRQMTAFCDISKEELNTIARIGRLDVENQSRVQTLSEGKKLFAKMIATNKAKGPYPHTDFGAFIWYRYIFYCMYAKKYAEAILGCFRGSSPAAWIKTWKLLYTKIKGRKSKHSEITLKSTQC